MHKPIQFKNVSLLLPQKVCFEDFTTQVTPASRIAIIGRNGIGKSTLLNILNKKAVPTGGEIIIPEGLCIGHVPQVITDFTHLSGGQSLNKALTEALACDPDLLLLDEPTNHLDSKNRKSLMRMLQSYAGTVILVSHDLELLRTCVDTFWHIDHGKIHIFSGRYDDLMHQICSKRAAIELELERLERGKKQMHEALMKEQERASKSRAKGHKSIEQRKWPTVVSSAKANRAMETSGRKKAEIGHKKQEIQEKLRELALPKVIYPTFSLQAAENTMKTIISVYDGSVGYSEEPLLCKISMSMTSKERVAIVGNNGSGKSTFVKALLADTTVITSGNWYMPEREHIGYVDQHYNTLSHDKTVVEVIQACSSHREYADLRRHLAAFLFCKNEEVHALVSSLSGGERARLTLAQIAAKTPKVLILDEITNNLDLETREHVIQVLKEYSGAMIVISHDADFLEEIGIQKRYFLSAGVWK